MQFKLQLNLEFIFSQKVHFITFWPSSRIALWHHESYDETITAIIATEVMSFFLDFYVVLSH